MVDEELIMMDKLIRRKIHGSEGRRKGVIEE